VEECLLDDRRCSGDTDSIVLSANTAFSMSGIDWLVLLVTILSIVGYGVYKSRGTKSIEGFLLADRKLPWYNVGLSVMATQASAITFLSAPGQGFTDGLRFVQFYFGLPLAMIVLCVTFVPMFKKLNVFTAYEFLEKRFDLKTRTFTAFLFLLQRGISTGITIYAPSLVLSSILHVDILYTTLFSGVLVIMYTVYGGTKAVAYTQLLQMMVIFSGLFMAAYMVVHLLPSNVGLVDALSVSGQMGRMNAIDLNFDWNNRYNIWSGIIGGFFLQLSYFGTDQSQVGRYLTGSSVAQSRLGLVMNGLVKIPMQFFILLIGTLVFSFYQFHPAPVFYNKVAVAELESGAYAADYSRIKEELALVNDEKSKAAVSYIAARESGDESAKFQSAAAMKLANAKADELRTTTIALMLKQNPSADVNDTNYIFLNFITDFLPVGLIGLLMAIIFLASMGSTASGLNSLASTTVVDVIKRLMQKGAHEPYYLSASRWATIGWGIFCIVIALYAGKIGNLIEAVNILGSLFYGTILGIFVVAFYFKSVNGNAVFWAAILAEIFVVTCWWIELTAFLWLNVIGCLLVVTIALIFSKLNRGKVIQQKRLP
jgi:Na+/proline symporter